MKKLVFAALVASAAIASPAAAQVVTGTVNITGSVPAKCTVLAPTAGSTFGGTVAMGDLSQANGTLKPTGTLSATFGSVNAAALVAKVVCTSANATVSVTSTPLVSPSGAGAPTGYSNRVDFQADVTFSRASLAALVVSDDSATAAATTSALGGRLDASAANNVSIAATNWRTPSATDILTSGTDYSGSIVVTITPL